MNFLKTPRLIKHLLPGMLWEAPSTHHDCIYLTFDDGPVPEATSFVLQALKDYNAQATFFCVGENIKRYPDIFRQVQRDKHRVGNHTYHHLNGWQTPNGKYLEDVAKCHQMMEKEAAYTTTDLPLFRPPYGRISPQQYRKLKHQYRLVMWDILSGDFDKNFSAELCLQKSIEHSRPGTIIIFHDSDKAFKNLTYVLPRYLAHFAAAGYQFKSL